MKAEFDRATIKIWFQNTSTSRNILNVIEIEHTTNLMCIKTAADKRFLINFENVNLIEEV